jgi:carbon-monoxide dehydrogenase large subunit
MIGQRIRRREDPRFITGKGQYGDDLELPGARHAAFAASRARSAPRRPHSTP